MVVCVLRNYSKHTQLNETIKTKFSLAGMWNPNGKQVFK